MNILQVSAWTFSKLLQGFRFAWFWLREVLLELLSCCPSEFLCSGPGLWGALGAEAADAVELESDGSVFKASLDGPLSNEVQWRDVPAHAMGAGTIWSQRLLPTQTILEFSVLGCNFS